MTKYAYFCLVWSGRDICQGAHGEQAECRLNQNQVLLFLSWPVQFCRAPNPRWRLILYVNNRKKRKRPLCGGGD